MPGDDNEERYGNSYKLGQIEQKMDFLIEQNREIKSDVSDLRNNLSSNYVTKSEFEIYQRGLKNTMSVVGLIFVGIQIFIFMYKGH